MLLFIQCTTSRAAKDVNKSVAHLSSFEGRIGGAFASSRLGPPREGLGEDEESRGGRKTPDQDRRWWPCQGPKEDRDYKSSPLVFISNFAPALALLFYHIPLAYFPRRNQPVLLQVYFNSSSSKGNWSKDDGEANISSQCECESSVLQMVAAPMPWCTLGTFPSHRWRRRPRCCRAACRTGARTS